MPDEQLRMTVIITTQTPLSIGAGGSSGTLADKSVLRDGNGWPIIPGSQVKGKVRHAAEQIIAALGLPGQRDFNDDETDVNSIRTIFGSPRHASPLFFDDLGLTLVPHAVRRAEVDSVLRPSVALNRQRRVAEDNRLLFQEVLHEGVVFQGNPAISGRLSLAHTALVWAALRLCTRWGGATSRGLGWASVEVEVTFGNQVLQEDALKTALHDLHKEAA